jgi:hypothetical protein
MLCPYFIDTLIIPAGGRALLAGSAMGKPEDVIDAGSRLVADTTIVGRGLAVGVGIAPYLPLKQPLTLYAS